MPLNWETYRHSNATVVILCTLYTLAYLVHGTVAGVDAVSRLKPGLWFSWQPFAVLSIAVASHYQMREPLDKTVAESHSTAVFSARRAAHIAAVTVWARCAFALLLLVVDTVYLLLHAVYCFSLDCPADPLAQCCAEGTLYGVALVGVLFQVLASGMMLFVCARLPHLPSFYLFDPIDAHIVPDRDAGIPPKKASEARTPTEDPFAPLLGPQIRALGTAHHQF